MRRKATSVCGLKGMCGKTLASLPLMKEVKEWGPSDAKCNTASGSTVTVTQVGGLWREIIKKRSRPAPLRPTLQDFLLGDSEKRVGKSQFARNVW